MRIPETLNKVIQPELDLKKIIGCLSGAVLFGMSLGFSMSVIGQFMLNREVAVWSDLMEKKLQDPDQKHYPKLEVIGGGQTLAERLKSERMGGSVDVRNFSSFSINILPGFSIPSRVVGTVNIGYKVENVILVNGWGVLKCDDVKGLNLRSQAERKPKLCAISFDNLASPPSFPEDVFKN